MRILALETTEMVGGVAALDGRKLLAELALDPRNRSAQSLAPGIKSLLGQVDWRPEDVQLVAVTVGPGSFTGLRVGVATAKTFAYAVGAEVLGVDTLETIAAGVPHDISAVSVAVDAQRGGVVAGSFVRDADGWFRPVAEGKLVDARQWLDSLPAGTLIAGPVLRKLADRAPDHVTVLDSQYWHPKAANVGLLAARDCEAGRRDDLWSLVPRYSRRSAAEEKWDEKNR